VLAEDAVQETLLAAVESAARFSGKSSLRTWLTGILKHKIIDQLRRTSREQPLATAGDERTEAEIIDGLFARDGHWHNFPGDWGNPDTAFENSRFWTALELCTQRLPPRTARVFMMREIMEMPNEEICQELNITATNCWVMLHRARLTLRECLDQQWFGKTT
jgi:RNA polymerase sigma-70 factor (ECF subfamily)